MFCAVKNTISTSLDRLRGGVSIENLHIVLDSYSAIYENNLSLLKLYYPYSVKSFSEFVSACSIS